MVMIRLYIRLNIKLKLPNFVFKDYMISHMKELSYLEKGCFLIKLTFIDNLVINDFIKATILYIFMIKSFENYFPDMSSLYLESALFEFHYLALSFIFQNEWKRRQGEKGSLYIFTILDIKGEYDILRV